MIPRLVFVLVALLALLGVGMLGAALERRGWSDTVITLVAAVLLTMIAYGVLTVGPTLS